MRFKIVASLFILLLLLTVSKSFSQSMKWEVEATDSITWLQVLNKNVVVFGTKDEIRALDSENGKLLWKLDDSNNADKSFFIDINSSTKSLLVRGENKYLPCFLDTKSGSIIANYDSTGVKRIAGLYLLPNNNLLIFSSNPYKNISMLVIDAETAKILWADSATFGIDKIKIFNNNGFRSIIGNQPPIFDTDSTIIIGMSQKYIRKWNFKTGELIWKQELNLNEHIAIADGFPPIVFDSILKVLYISKENTLLAINSINGKLLWESEEFERDIEQTVSCDSNIVLLTTKKQGAHKYSQLIVLAKSNGLIAYKSKKKLHENHYQSLLSHNGSIFYHNENHIYKFDIEKKKVKKFSDKFKFKHGDKPEHFSIKNNHFYLTSPQNLVCVDSTGKTVFHTSVEPPGPGLGAAILDMARVVGVVVSASMGNFFYEPSFLDKSIFKNSAWNGDYIYMVMDKISVGNKGEPGLAKVNILTGEIESEIALSTKFPIYAIDKSNGHLYFLSDEKKIACYAW